MVFSRTPTGAKQTKTFRCLCRSNSTSYEHLRRQTPLCRCRCRRSVNNRNSNPTCNLYHSLRYFRDTFGLTINPLRVINFQAEQIHRENCNILHFIEISLTHSK